MALPADPNAPLQPRPAMAPKAAPNTNLIPDTLPMAQAPTTPTAPTPIAPPAAPNTNPIPNALPMAPAPATPPTTLPMAAGAPPSIGPRPTATASDWQTADARGAAWDKANEARSAAAGAADNANGYNPFETQEQLNVRRGLSINPANGSWDRADERQPYFAPQPTPQGSPQITDVPAYLKAINTSGSPEAQQFAPPGYSLGANGWALGGSAGASTLPIAPPTSASDAHAAIPNSLPLAQGSSSVGVSQGTPGRQITPGPANDIGGSIPLAGIASPAAAGGGVGYGTNDLTGSTIQPGAGLDRVGLARSLIAENRANSEPQWQAEQRALTQNAAARGQTGSGMFRTSLGDAARQHELDLAHADTGFLSDALHGSVDDQYRNIGIAQQQQGYQAGQQQTAFQQAVVQQQVEEALRQGDFSRAMALLTAGDAENPSDVALTLAGNYGNQASAAGAGAASLLNSGAQNKESPYDAYLRKILGVQANGDPAAPAPIDLSGMTLPNIPTADSYYPWAGG